MDRKMRVLLTLTVVLVIGLCRFQPLNAEDKPAPKDDASDLPVILLTGFEPFGPGRPANPSWEGVKRLDGKQWKGHRLVAKQLPVEWGAPLEHLTPWLDELKPVAVFSFGQGGGYALETLADNQRGGGRDNRGERAANKVIVADGPEKIEATIDAAALAKVLARRGHHVGISREAGNYLCEECLYSLEHLKAQKKLDKVTVLFCHIPPLSDRYSAADAEQFMQDMLEAWYEVYPQAEPEQSK
jgi:pyroglutamyl-peptidase